MSYRPLAHRNIVYERAVCRGFAELAGFYVDSHCGFVQGRVILGHAWSSGQRQSAVAAARFATTRDPVWLGQRTERVNVRKNNKIYEASSRGSPPGYESWATGYSLRGPCAYSRCHRGTTSAFGFG